MKESVWRRMAANRFGTGTSACIWFVFAFFIGLGARALRPSDDGYPSGLLQTQLAEIGERWGWQLGGPAPAPTASQPGHPHWCCSAPATNRVPGGAPAATPGFHWPHAVRQEGTASGDKTDTLGRQEAEAATNSAPKTHRDHEPDSSSDTDTP